MKRLLLPGAVLLLVLAVASIVLAQVQAPSSGPARLKTPTGEHPITYVAQSGQVYVAVAEVVAGLGGRLESDASGYRVTVGNSVAAFGPDSRYGVIRDDLIEMPVPPIVIEERPFVPWQFFHGFLSRSAGMEVVWDGAAHLLIVRPQQRDAVGVQVSVANVQGITKMVVTLSAAAEYSIVKQPSAYAIRFRTPLHVPFTEQTYEDANVSKISFVGPELRVQLTGADVVGDAYELENPVRIVLDLRKGAAPSPDEATPRPGPGRPQKLPGIRTIVVDPGHGGKEVGAVGPGGLMEKDVTLQLCRRLASALAAKVGARVILTREDDRVVSLDQRTALANEYEADLFLSVHLNAAAGKDARGSETYFLSLEASDELAQRAAELENASSPDSESDLKLILWDLAQQAYLDESSRFAQTIQEELNTATSTANRGVKQAPFKVLLGATMPAALVEVAFISNAEEEARLQSEAFQNTIVDAITRAVQRYKSEYEVRIGVVKPPAPPATTTQPATTTRPPAAVPAPAAPKTPAPTATVPETRTE